MGKSSGKVQCTKCLTYNPEDSSYCHKCGSPMEPTRTFVPSRDISEGDFLLFSPGDRFGERYRIIEEIGRGGMGRVYKAEDLVLGITVALKIIRPGLSSHPQFIRRFKKETLLARSISHENVIRIHDIGEEAKVKFISMEYIHGQNLNELIYTSGTLSVETAVKVTKQICAALSAAHQKDIIHRDLKPGNIMIDNSGRVYVMDFGLARSTQADDLDRPGALVGTPAYYSPEQAQAQTIDARSDNYALGIILYKMLTGRLPFEAEDPEGYRHKHIHEKPKPPSRFNPHIPQHLDRIILKCLQKDRTKRYQTAEAVHKDLEAFERKALQPSVPIWKKRAFRILFAPALAVFLVIGFFLLRRQAPPLSGDQKPSVAVLDFENRTGNPELDYLKRAIATSVIYDLQQSKYIRLLTADRLFEILDGLGLTDFPRFTRSDLEKIASRSNINHILQGHFDLTNEAFTISAALLQTDSWKDIGHQTIKDQDISRLSSMVDILTREIKEDLHLSRKQIAQDFDSEVGKIYTSSPEAMYFYLEGMRYYNEGRFEESNQFYEKAVDIDPGFALAYRRISENYHYLADFELAKEYVLKAQASSLSERVSHRERFLIQAWAASILEGSYSKPVEIYEKLLRQYPDDEDGNIGLGAIYRNMEEWDLAAERFDKVIHTNPELAYDNLFNIYMATGAYDRAWDTLQANQQVFSNPAVLHTNLGLFFLCQGKYELALVEVNKSLALEPANLLSASLKGHLFHLQNKFMAAEEAYAALLDSAEPSMARFWLGHLYLTQGRHKRCVQEIRQGIAEAQEAKDTFAEIELLLFLAYVLERQGDGEKALEAAARAKASASAARFRSFEKIALHHEGMSHIRRGNLDGAVISAEELLRVIKSTGHDKHMRYYHHLLGQIALSRSQPKQSTAGFKKALSMMHHQKDTYDEHALFMSALASAYEKSGDLDKARTQYEEITALTTGRLHWGDLYAQSHFRLGKICQKKNWPGMAAQHYRNYLKIMESADPDLPELKDARRQLALIQ